MSKYTLNVGCGERVYGYYPDGEHKCVNIDERKLPHVEHVVDVSKDLPFEDEHFDYILASDIVEHFPIAKTKEVIKNWLRVLRKNGVIEFRLPNLKAIIKHYQPDKKGWKNAEYVSWLLYGGQDYPGNFHYVCFDRAWFREICNDVGLLEISYKEDGFNMIIKMEKVGG